MPVDTSDQATPDFLSRAHIIFVSHAGADYTRVAETLLPELARGLWDYHCENSLTRAGTSGSELYRKSILKSLSRCGACLVFLSRQAVSSEWVKLEATSALTMRKPVFVLLSDETQPEVLVQELEKCPSAHLSLNGIQEVIAWLRRVAREDGT